MARFPHYKRNAKALGELLAKASLDPTLKKKLFENPNKMLSEIGLPAQATELLNFKVVEGKADLPTIALPFRLNSKKLAQSNPQYLSDLGRLLQ
ncbi:hypothetical protein [uncultured Roseibium sp.]|uniref:hypothetical protein n=1 Tax=uncultured Roseibium sp. TaxID=1936171 RepID=UPI00260DE8A9|nr:hypothetical protein [uncultured Roseibium sp.]